MRTKKTIVICSSVAFYKDVLDIEKQLVSLGYDVRVPETAKKMEKTGDFDEKKQKTWYQDPSTYSVKTTLMKNHFKEITKGDAILVVNNRKNNIDGYIGGNTLMEIAIAFQYKIPIYILNPIADTLPIKEEIYGVFPTFLNGDLKNIPL
jgi:hypothetical protein